MQKMTGKKVLNLNWSVVFIFAMILAVPAVFGEEGTEKADSNATKGEIRGYRAERDPKTGKMVTYPVYGDQEENAVRYRVKTDASGEPVKDEEGNFLFVAEPNAPRPVPLVEESTYSPSEPVPSKLLPSEYSVDIGPEIYHFKYKEPGYMEEEGMFYGVRFGITYRDWPIPELKTSEPDGGGMFRAEGRLAFGRVDYDGALMDGTPYKINGINDLAFEGRLLLGHDQLSAETLSTLYFGVGYRYLNDDLATDPAGYERESNYLYVPFGFNIDIGQKVGWSLGFGAEFDLFVLGRQESHLSDYDPLLPDVDNDQDSGYGYRASVKLQNKSENSVFIIEPFFRYWDIDKSDVEPLGYEPANETTEFGLELIWLY